MGRTHAEPFSGTAPGERITIEPNYIVLSDGAPTDVIDRIRKVATPNRVWVFHDHSVPTGTIEAARMYRRLYAFSKAHKAHFVQGKGIGHCHLLSRYIKPGDVVVGGEHPSIVGGQMALGLALSDDGMRAVLETGRLDLTVPDTYFVNVEGALPRNGDIMDAAMLLLKEAKDIGGKLICLHAPQLSTEEKRILCAMATKTGALTALIAAGRAANAHYTLRLDRTEPMVTLPCKTRADQVRADFVAVRALRGTPVNAGQIGGGIEVLRRAAGLMENRKLALGFRLSIVPATDIDYLAAMDEGLLERFIDYGAQIHAVGDHSIVDSGAGAVGNGERLLTTGLYTFDGCMGSPGAEVFTASVKTIIEASYTKTL